MSATASEPEDKISVESLPCPRCGKVHTLRVYPSHWKVYKANEVCIQHALPELSAGERETLITGLCPECWGPWLEGK